MTNNNFDMNNFNWEPLADLLANLIAKYIDKINLDELPDPVKPLSKSDYSTKEYIQTESQYVDGIASFAIPS